MFFHLGYIVLLSVPVVARGRALGIHQVGQSTLLRCGAICGGGV